VALRAVEHYDISVASVRLINAGFNFTYRVQTTSGEKYALRLNINSRRSIENLSGEVSWTSALARDSQVRVPVPQHTRDGELFMVLDDQRMEREVPAVLYSWLPGRNLDATNAVAAWFRAGETMSMLHDHAQRFVLPDRARVPELRTALWGTPDRLDRDHLPITAEDESLLRELHDEIDRRLDRLWSHDDGRLLHADLHGGNMKWLRGELAVFDFDDCGWGLPIQDLATTAYYIRDQGDCERAFLDGYESATHETAPSPEDREWLLVQRNLLLLSDLAGTTTRELQDFIPRYTSNSLIKLRAFVSTGVYHHDVEGVLNRR
jgi:Ser/Thr protein kinase RdoA (MazF antagonist)